MAIHCLTPVKVDSFFCDLHANNKATKFAI